MMEEIAKQYAEVSKNLSEVKDKLKENAEKARVELENTNNLSKDTAVKVDELLNKQSEMQANMRAMEQELATAKEGLSFANGKREPKTLKDFALSNEDFVKQVRAMAQNGYKGTATLEIRNAVSSVIDGGNMVEPQRIAGILKPNQPRLTIRDLLSWGTTRSNAIEYIRETGFTNAADFVKENPTNAKPESDISFDLQSASVETLAHWIPAPKQVLDDVAMLSSYLGTRLIEGLKYKEEQALLYGTGDGVTIKGINVQASSFNTTNLGELLDTNSTIIDVLRVALLQAELAEHDADAIVLNPIDWTKIELLKDSNGNYLYANPHVLNPRGLWGKSVVSTKTMTANNYLVGAFASGAMGWDREQVNVRVSTEDRDNFVKNMVTILCEERLGLTVFRPEAFVKGTLIAG